MGLEAECTARVGRKTSAGRALLEGDTLIFRGDFSLQIPFDAMRDVTVDGPTLVVKTADQEARFEIGPAIAERWLRLIKEPKGLFEKLEVGPQSRVAVVTVNDSLFVTALRERAAAVVEGRVPEGFSVVFFGAESREALQKIHLLRARMSDQGVLWIVRPKGSKAIGENDVYDAVRAASMVDTKVVAFSKTHTAHKCVIPLEMRGQPVRVRPPIVSIPPSAPLVQPKKGGSANAKPGAKAGKPAKPPKPVTKKAKPAEKKAKPPTVKGKPAKKK
ncbi:MAG TPA: hypothetical protein VGG39_18745 [Polyangiaceae bacterium]|jgi:hypothetical protein